MAKKINKPKTQSQAQIKDAKRMRSLQIMFLILSAILILSMVLSAFSKF